MVDRKKSVRAAVAIGFLALGLVFAYGGYAAYRTLQATAALEGRITHLEGQQQRLIKGHNEVVQAIKQMAPKPIQRTPLDQAGYEDSFIQAWVIQSQVESLTFAYHDYKLRLQRAYRFYNKAGFDFFVKALQASEILPAVIDNRALISIVPLEQPVFRTKGVENGLYRWDVTMPVRLVYRTDEKTYTADWLLAIKVVRVNDPAYVNGIAIESWAAYTYQPDVNAGQDGKAGEGAEKK